jgi:bacillithiol biosynthesis deacetylase BshB1
VVDVLAIAAHPDDVELTCGGTLAMLAERGYTFGILDLTRGEMGTRGTAEARGAEAQRAAQILGASFREALDFGDGGLKISRENELVLIEVIRREKPRLILTSYPDDRHPDHRRAGQIVRDAAFYAGLRRVETAHPAHRPQQTLYFSTGYVHPVNVYVDVTPVIAKRRAAMAAFESQFHNPSSREPQTILSAESFLAQIEARARTFGFEIGVEFAEAFTSFRPPKIEDLLKAFEGYEPGF